MPEVFLSEEWIAAAKQLQADYEDRIPKIDHVVAVNLLVTEAPLGEGEVEAHLDTSSGSLVIETGHVEGADLFVTVTYDTAKALLVEGNPNAAMQAFLQNRIRVEGDVSKLMVLTQLPFGDAAVEYAQELQALTA